MTDESDAGGDKLQADLSLDERKFIFEKQKYDDERKMNTEKIQLQEQELSQKRSDPLMVAVVGGIIAAFANVAVSYYNGAQQVAAEKTKHSNELDSEKYKTEASRISDAVNSSDQTHNACQLYFLLDFDLVTNENLKARINKFLRDKKGPEIPGLKPTTAAGFYKESEYTSICTIVTTSPPLSTKTKTDGKSANPPEDHQKDTNSPSQAKKFIQSLVFSTGWIGGGHSQNEACAQALAAYRQQFPGKIVETSGASEDVRKDFIGHVTYNYHCVVNVFDPPPPVHSSN